MSLLPKLWLIVNRKSLIVIILALSLITYHLSLITGSVVYAADPPNPKPCQDALPTDQYTKVVLEPKEFTFTAVGNNGQWINLFHTFDVQVDFSKLAAIFAAANSNYLESDFQSESHRMADITSLNSQDFNSNHGPGQKAAPQVIIDELKKNYVNYVYDKPTLKESANKYTDIEGKGDPKTIYDLVNLYGQPDPQNLSDDWGKYWDKIPTAVNEYYYGILRFVRVVGDKELDAVKKGGCPEKPPRSIYFVMPNYFRTTSLSNELNQIIVPQAVQSSQSDFVQKTLFAKAINNTKSAFADLAQTCLSIFPDSPLKDSLKKAVKISLEFLSPVKNVYAANIKPVIPPGGFQDPCPAPIPLLPNDKKGQGPFCSLPQFQPGTTEPQLEPGETCSNVDSPFKEDPSGQLVKCNFKISFFSQRPINGPGTWDSCQLLPNGQFICSLTVRVFPTFYIPWLATIWNNTTYSDKADEIAIIPKNTQETGKPGVYPFFIPGGVDTSAFPDGKNLPSKEQQSTDQIKQRFFGGTENGQEFAKNCALMPIALREYLDIQTCDNLTPAP